MNFDSSFFTYFLNAGLMVKCVMLLLISGSIISWATIFQRSNYIRKIRRSCETFEDNFFAIGDLNKVYTNSMRNKASLCGLEAIFNAGFKEFLRLKDKIDISHDAIMRSVKRAMRSAQMREQDKLELHLPILATVGSTSPYVGLFGTVWGIMLSFKALSNVQQATISMVAPGIAEALVATALGLFAAIPAVVAYNRFIAETTRLLNKFDVFQDECENILFRHIQHTLSRTEYATA